MKAFVIDKNSWHYQLMRFGHSDWYIDEAHPDICSYTHSVFWMLFKVLLLIAAVSAVLSIAVAIPLATFAAWATTGVSFMDFWAYMLDKENAEGWVFLIQISAILWMAGTVVSGFVLTAWGLAKLNETSRPITIPTPGFVKQAYSSWKDKYCVPIRFTDKVNPS